MLAEPYEEGEYFDPTPDPTFSLCLFCHAPKIANEPFVSSGVTGKWYYICQTDSTWELGQYYIETTVTDGTYEDFKKEKVFTLTDI